MNAPGRWLSIIGIGEDGTAGLTPAAQALIAQAALVVGGQRHLDLLGDLGKGERMAWPSPMHDAFPAILARRGEPVAVVASGDPFFYGVGSVLAAQVPADEMVCLPGISAFSSGCRAPGLGTAGLRAGDPARPRCCERVLPALQTNSKVLALSWDGTTPAEAGRIRWCAMRFGDTRMIVCEAMGGPERTATDEPLPKSLPWMASCR